MKVFELSKEFGITNKELIDFLKNKGYKISSHSQNLNDEMIKVARSEFNKTEKINEDSVDEKKPEVKKQPKQYNQNDYILCRSVTAGWLGVPGKSGQYYVFANAGDECEIEYQDLFALKNSRSRYIFDPLFVIEDEELLDHPRWTDLRTFYEDKVFTHDDVIEILNLPNNKFEDVIKDLPRGLAKTLQVEVAQKIEDGTFDSLSKIKAIDETFGTDFMSIIDK